MEKIICATCGADNATTSKYCLRCGYELPKTEQQEPKEAPEKQTTDKKENRKKITGIIAGAIVFGISYFAVQQLFFKPPSYDKVMMEAANELNKTCPVMVDAETRLDNTIALPENIFQYNYTLVNVEKESITAIEDMKNYLEQKIINDVRTNPQMQFQRNHGTTMNYQYKDKNGVNLFLISITPEKYADQHQN